jgi:hypothetical protein
MIVGGELSLPYVIETTGGWSYTITDHSNAFFTKAYPETLVVAIPEKGIMLVGLKSIDAIHHEHEAAARGTPAEPTREAACPPEGGHGDRKGHRAGQFDLRMGRL